VVEDELAIAESVAYVLTKAGHQVELAHSLKDARAAIQKAQPPVAIDLVLLDLMLPDGSGFDWILELESKRDEGLAVIVLSSRDGEADRVRALEMGADDYVTKPFSTKEIGARITAVLRRLTPRSSEQPAARLAINLDTRRATVDEKAMELTRVEFDLLSLLLQKRGQVYPRSLIIDEVWGAGFALSDRTIDSHIKALRKKILDQGGSPDWIETVRGIGYRAAAQESNP